MDVNICSYVAYRGKDKLGPARGPSDQFSARNEN